METRRRLIFPILPTLHPFLCPHIFDFSKCHLSTFNFFTSCFSFFLSSSKDYIFIVLQANRGTWEAVLRLFRGPAENCEFQAVYYVNLFDWRRPDTPSFIFMTCSAFHVYISGATRSTTSLFTSFTVTHHINLFPHPSTPESLNRKFSRSGARGISEYSWWIRKCQNRYFGTPKKGFTWRRMTARP